jgi:type I restriction enzyme S subunit
LLNYWAKDLSRTAQGSTFEAVSKADLENLWVFCPENEEQHSISNVLDALDTQIQQTETLIAKLQQVKMGLRHDLLTRGIDENGEVRDPVAHPEKFKEVSFLQKRVKIPEKCEIKPLNSLLINIDAGKSPSCPDQPAGAGEWGVLKVSAVHPTGFRAEENKVIINPAYINPAYEVHDGDLLMSRANTYELVGMVCLVRNPRTQLLLCDKTLRLQVNTKNALSEFIFYMLQMPSSRIQIEMHATGSSGSMKNISQNSIKNLAIYAPPLEEQEQIIAILGAQDRRIATEEAHLTKLRQIKKGLMDDLLSGRVQVTELITDDGQKMNISVVYEGRRDCVQ